MLCFKKISPETTAAHYIEQTTSGRRQEVISQLVRQGSAISSIVVTEAAGAASCAGAAFNVRLNKWQQAQL